MTNHTAEMERVILEAGKTIHKYNEWSVRVFRGTVMVNLNNGTMICVDDQATMIYDPVNNIYECPHCSAYGETSSHDLC